MKISLLCAQAHAHGVVLHTNHRCFALHYRTVRSLEMEGDSRTVNTSRVQSTLMPNAILPPGFKLNASAFSLGENRSSER